MTCHVFSVPPATPFLDALIQGMRARFPDQDWTRAKIFLPTKRACRLFQEKFFEAWGRETVLLPQIIPLGEFDFEELLASAQGDVPPLPEAIDPVTRLGLLAELIMAQHDYPLQHALSLAESLADFLNQLQIYHVDFAALRAIVPDDYAIHWQKILDFLQIIETHWPQILAAKKLVDPIQRHIAFLSAQMDSWQKNPPQDLIIAAGSTGSQPTTAEFLTAIQNLPQGYVVLPGLDHGLDEESFAAVDVTHPQYHLSRLIQKFERARDDVMVWHDSKNEIAEKRAAFLREVTAPPSIWRPRAKDFSPDSFQNIEWVEATHPAHEARIVALILRDFLEHETGKAQLVTPDRALAMRVIQELKRWQIHVDDSSGLPMAQSLWGRFLRLLAAYLENPEDWITFLALMKHPAVALGEDHSVVSQNILAFEKIFLRADGAWQKMLDITLHDEEEGIAFAFWQNLQDKMRGFFFKAGDSLPQRFQKLLSFWAFLVADQDEDGATKITKDDEAARIYDHLTHWQNHLGDFTLAPRDSFSEIVSYALSREVIRPQSGTQHPRLHILGPLEARLQESDLIILAGLNEGSWPPLPDTDPWLSRMMKKDLELPSPERRIGLNAHDFVQAFANRRVVMTRAVKEDGTPSLPARWWLRLEKFLESLDQKTALNPSKPWAEWALQMDVPRQSAGESMRVARPMPCPPIAARPQKLSVTKIGTWMRDPYHLYAEVILKLESLNPLRFDPDARDRGTMVHDILEKFTKETSVKWPEDPKSFLYNLMTPYRVLLQNFPQLYYAWWARLEQNMDSFLKEDKKRRDNLRKLYAEEKGRMKINYGSDQEFEITAKADRIEELLNGEMAILDYKTGKPPSAPDVARGLSPQLPLEALMLRAGGFQGIAAKNVTIAALGYWQIAPGSDDKGVKILDKKNLPEILTASAEGIQNLLNAFQNPAQPYHVLPWGADKNPYSDYKHLARMAEWANDESEAA